ncbi:MAG: AAA family ATPase [Rubrivivax sp.]
MLARADCRLLTLVGPGGSGKSSLARRVAAGRSALWIELQDLPTAAAALERLAQQLGFDLDERRDAVGSLVHLAAEPPLVVLDNAEHLEGLAANVERLLHGHRTLKVLVTSRERLHLPDEWLLPLAGLALPDEDSRDFDAAASFDAVRLFDARSRAAQRGFELRRHLPQVLAVLDAVGGLPLAIELAAGWCGCCRPKRSRVSCATRSTSSRATPRTARAGAA